MRLLLLNNNPAVSRLIKLSVDKVGYAMDEFDDYGLVPLTNYDVIMVDNELYDEVELKVLSEQVHCEYFLYICQRGSEKPALMNVSLEKPFLPTDFLTLLEKIKNVVNSAKVDESQEEPIFSKDNNDDAMQDFDIDIFGLEEENEVDLLEAKEDDSEDEETQEDTLHFTLDLEDEEEKDKENKEPDGFEEISSSILDKDDISEIKQLLNENNDEDEEEAVAPMVTLEMEDIDSLDVESLDGLNENLLKKAFSKEVKEEESPQESVQEIEVMRGEIESSIARSLSGFVQSDILREALKGMKINISITFDEKN